jgi:hypothetical protein
MDEDPRHPEATPFIRNVDSAALYRGPAEPTASQARATRVHVRFSLWLVACGLWLVACGLWPVACALCRGGCRSLAYRRGVEQADPLKAATRTGEFEVSVKTAIIQYVRVVPRQVESIVGTWPGGKTPWEQLCLSRRV